VDHRYVSVATGLTGLVTLTKKLEAFAEWYGIYPAGAIGPEPGRSTSPTPGWSGS
jgi:hypothetical protein